jgi:hypothetical protein
MLKESYRWAHLLVGAEPPPIALKNKKCGFSFRVHVHTFKEGK